MGIDRAARAHAWLEGRDYVGPEDIQAVASDVLRHRLVMSVEAEADGITADSVIEGVLDGVYQREEADHLQRHHRYRQTQKQADL